MSDGAIMLLVVFVDRTDGESVVLRLVPARKATDCEEQLYRAAAP